jgi:hypothetical protein
MLPLRPQIDHNLIGYALSKFLVFVEQPDDLVFLEPIEFVRNPEKRFDHLEGLFWRSHAEAQCGNAYNN